LWYSIDYESIIRW